MSDGDSCTLKYFQGEPKELAAIRQMWDEIFDDPEAFADFYFEEKCKNNRILLAYKKEEAVGMIHLNPYMIEIDGTSALCYYIVGVGVKPEHREQGIMHAMMQRVLADLKEEGCIWNILVRMAELLRFMKMACIWMMGRWKRVWLVYLLMTYMTIRCMWSVLKVLMIMCAMYSMRLFAWQRRHFAEDW